MLAFRIKEGKKDNGGFYKRRLLEFENRVNVYYSCSGDILEEHFTKNMFKPKTLQLCQMEKLVAGGQNDWKQLGKIAIVGDLLRNENRQNVLRNVIKYKKGHVTKNTRRKDNECWTAGTPVIWDDDPSKAKTVTIKLAGIPDMLVSRVNGQDH